jgi:hypothetical protein
VSGVVDAFVPAPPRDSIDSKEVNSMATEAPAPPTRVRVWGNRCFGSRELLDEGPPLSLFDETDGTELVEAGYESLGLEYVYQGDEHACLLTLPLVEGVAYKREEVVPSF